MRPIPVPIDRVRTRLSLVLLCVLAAILAWSVPGAAVGPFLFQSSPPGSPTPATGFDRSPLATTGPRPAATPSPAPTQAVPTAEASPLSLATSSNYLPPPTLTSPGILPPVIQPPLPAQPEPDEGSSQEVAHRSPAAELIDNILVAFGYVWLCCGSFALAGAAVAVVWLVRHNTTQ